jgi:hypothetical protein
VKYDFIDYFYFINIYLFFESIEYGPSEWRKHVFIALLRNGVFDRNSVNYLSFGRDNWSWSNRLLLLLSGKDGSSSGLALIWDFVLVISQRLLELTESKVVLEVERLIFF